MRLLLRRAAFLVLSMTGEVAVAQDAEPGAADVSRPTLTVTNDTAATVRISLQTPPIPITVQAVMPPSTSCRAELHLDFQQRNTMARVKGELVNADCAASSGEYTLAVSVAGDDGTRQTLEFSEAWQREDDQSYTFESDYPIGENVQLVNVRAPRLNCTCVVAPERPE